MAGQRPTGRWRQIVTPRSPCCVGGCGRGDVGGCGRGMSVAAGGLCRRLRLGGCQPHDATRDAWATHILPEVVQPHWAGGGGTRAAVRLSSAHQASLQIRSRRPRAPVARRRRRRHQAPAGRRRCKSGRSPSARRLWGMLRDASSPAPAHSWMNCSDSDPTTDRGARRVGPSRPSRSRPFPTSGAAQAQHRRSTAAAQPQHSRSTAAASGAAQASRPPPPSRLPTQPRSLPGRLACAHLAPARPRLNRDGRSIHTRLLLSRSLPRSCPPDVAAAARLNHHRRALLLLLAPPGLVPFELGVVALVLREPQQIAKVGGEAADLRPCALQASEWLDGGVGDARGRTSEGARRESSAEVV